MPKDTGFTPNGICRYCGLGVAWLGHASYAAYNANGTLHNQTCPAKPKEYRNKVRDNEHERKVAEFLRGKR